MSNLLQEITVMMTDPSQAQNETKIEQIMEKIRALNINKSSEELRLASCHFMTMYHTRKAMTIGMPDQQMGGMNPMDQAQPSPTDQVNLKAVESFKEAQRRDMELGWDLLSIKGSNTATARTSRVLKIEVAQRLEDSIKLKEAFDDLMKRGLSDEENLVAFTAAPFLGDWKTMMKLGKRIERMPGGMEQLHMMSLQLPIPDFTLVYELCKKHKLQRFDTPDASTLTWDLWSVRRIRVKFIDVDCGQFDEKRQELLAEIKKQGDVEWEDVPNISHVHLKRMGALCQAVSFGEIPMMLNGPWLKDKINVLGRAEMPLMSEEQQMQAMNGGNPYGPGSMPDPSKMTILIQEEEWNLVKDKNNQQMYKGSYTLKQRPHLPPTVTLTSEHAPVNMSFECEIFLGDAPSESDISESKNSNSNSNSNRALEYKNADDDEAVDAAIEKVVTDIDGLCLD